MNKIIEKLENKKVAILGFGKEGYSTYKYFRKYLKEQELTIMDKNIMLKEKYLELQDDQNVKFILGDDYLKCLDNYDIVIKSPGISLDDISVNTLVTSQMELVLNNIDVFVIGITGTKGKSTTSSLIYQILKDQQKDVYLVGNIGNPILDYVDLINDETIFVTEFSAHQLYPLKKSPNIGIILNLFEEHLDFFKTVDKYYNAKLNMFRYQTENDYVLYFKDNQTLISYVDKMSLKSQMLPITLDSSLDNCIYSDKKYVYKKTNGKLKELYNLNDKRKLIGEHNAVNIMFALGVVYILNLDKDKAIESINKFESLKHRLQYVGVFKDIIFYNDTIATIPSATLNGINSLEKVDTLIFGGLDRGIDYSSFATDLGKTTVNNFICMPDTGYKIGVELENKNKKVYYIEELEDAVKLAYKITEKNKICFLSPAAPSYNRYKNFEEKGDKYIEFIKKYSE